MPSGGLGRKNVDGGDEELPMIKTEAATCDQKGADEAEKLAIENDVDTKKVTAEGGVEESKTTAQPSSSSTPSDDDTPAAKNSSEPSAPKEEEKVEEFDHPAYLKNILGDTSK